MKTYLAALALTALWISAAVYEYRSNIALYGEVERRSIEHANTHERVMISTKEYQNA